MTTRRIIRTANVIKNSNNNNDDSCDNANGFHNTNCIINEATKILTTMALNKITGTIKEMLMLLMILNMIKETIYSNIILLLQTIINNINNCSHGDSSM